MPKRSNGEGHLEILKSGKVRATLFCGKDHLGKPVRERKTFKNRSDAWRWLKAKSAERRGEWSRRSLGDWLDRWLADKAGEVEPASLKWYTDRVERRIRPHLGMVRLGDLRAIHVRDWMTKLSESGVSNRDRHGALKTLRAALASAMNLGQISANVAKEGVKLPKLATRQFTTWTPEEARAFLKAAEGWPLESLWWVALDTGMRPGELFGLHWSDVGTGSVRVRQSLEWIVGRQPRLKEPKTETGRRLLSISPATAARLQAHRDQMRHDGYDTTSGPVWVNARGNWLRLKETGDRLRAVIARAGVPRIRLYDLRHTSATILLAAGVNLKIVSQRLGHTDVAITLRHYAGAMPGMQDLAVAVMQSALSPTVTPAPAGQNDTDSDSQTYVI